MRRLRIERLSKLPKTLKYLKNVNTSVLKFSLLNLGEAQKFLAWFPVLVSENESNMSISHISLEFSYHGYNWVLEIESWESHGHLQLNMFKIIGLVFSSSLAFPPVIFISGNGTARSSEPDPGVISGSSFLLLPSPPYLNIYLSADNVLFLD